MQTQDTFRRLYDSKGKQIVIVQVTTMVGAGETLIIAPAVSGKCVLLFSYRLLTADSLDLAFKSINSLGSAVSVVPSRHYGASTAVEFASNQLAWAKTFQDEGLAIVNSAGTQTVTLWYAYATDGEARTGGQLVVANTTQSEVSTPHTATITVNRRLGIAGDIGFSYATADGTAVAGVNYTSASGNATIGDNVGSATIGVPIVTGDAALDKTFTLTISAPTGGATLGTNVTDTVTIAHL